MRLALITVLTDETGQVQVGWLEHHANFLVRFAASTCVGRFAEVHLELAAARAPEAAIRLLRAFEQQDFVALIENVEQRGDLEIFANNRIHSKIQRRT